LSREEIRHLMEKARRSVRSAGNLIEDGHLDFAIARAYYAMFYAAQAALLAHGINRAKHSAVIAAVGEAFVKTGKFDRAHHQALHRAFLDYSKAEYDLCVPSREAVESRIAKADAFVVTASELAEREVHGV